MSQTKKSPSKTKPVRAVPDDAEPRELPASFAKLLEKKPDERSVFVHMDPSRAVRVMELEASLATLEAQDEAHDDVEAELEAAREALAETTSELVFRSIGREAYDALVIGNPPTDEQNAEHVKQFGIPAPYNSDTFPVELIASSLVRIDDEDVEVSAAEVSLLFDAWNGTEVIQLFEAALAVNTSRRTSLGNS